MNKPDGEEDEHINNTITSIPEDTVAGMDPGSGLRPQVDASAARQMASPRTPHPSFHGLHDEVHSAIHTDTGSFVNVVRC
jgi:hypothetical protein